MKYKYDEINHGSILHFNADELGTILAALIIAADRAAESNQQNFVEDYNSLHNAIWREIYNMDESNTVKQVVDLISDVFERPIKKELGEIENSNGIVSRHIWGECPTEDCPDHPNPCADNKCSDPEAHNEGAHDV